MAAEAGADTQKGNAVLPAWLAASQDYEPASDKDRFIARSALSIASVLRHLRIDDGRGGALSPSAPVKLVFALGCITLTSLSSNFFFVLVMLACVIARACLLPSDALGRIAALSCSAAAMSFLVMLPAALIGQSHAALLIATKVLVSVSVVLTVSLSTPAHELSAALRSFHVPDLVILTLDLALKNIVKLGDVALEVLTALRLRSVGANSDKAGSLGGVGGVVFLKANEAAEETYAAMRCRGFEGSYQHPHTRTWRHIDIAWLAALALLIAAFAYLQGAVS